MTYLSRRMREIRGEERRVHVIVNVGLDYGFDNIVFEPMADSYRDRDFRKMQDRVFAAYEETLRARNPMGYTSPINFKGRAG